MLLRLTPVAGMLERWRFGESLRYCCVAQIGLWGAVCRLLLSGPGQRPSKTGERTYHRGCSSL